MFFRVLFLLFILQGCSGPVEKAVENAFNEKDPQKALSILSKAYEKASRLNQKIELLEAQESILKTKLRDPELLKKLFVLKSFILKDKKKKNKNYLQLSQLLLQNLKDEEGALHYLAQINESSLRGKQREQYFQLLVLANMNAKKYDQAIIEAKTLIKRSDLSPSERFKIQVLLSRSYVMLKSYIDAEKQYRSLISDFPNLSKKWKIRSQLALVYEDQKKYKSAIQVLKQQYELEGKNDELLRLRIKDITDRHEQQPGAKGRLRK